MTIWSDNPLAAAYARLSTGLKMLLILGIGLFPLGLVAILASVSNAHTNLQNRRDAAQDRIELQAQRLDSVVGRSVVALRTANAAALEAGARGGFCDATLRRLARVQELQGRFALFAGENRPRCATEGYAPALSPPLIDDVRSSVTIVPGADVLQITLYDPAGRPEGAAEFPRDTLARLADLPGSTRMPYDLFLEQGSRSIPLRGDLRDRPLAETVETESPALGGRVMMRLRTNEEPVALVDVIIILLPVAMWAFAGAIGWLIVNGLLLKPLKRMERAIAAYRPGDRNLVLPLLATPAKEIERVGQAFDRVTQTVARHEAELEAAIERQTKLVREVHHRVKNNLQVVASLLNLHSRGATSDEVAAAYASIQRRVDALAVVHRNHYAELEENRGVALRPLISELGANLRATAPAAAAQMPVRIDIEPLYVTQDTAVSIAFLVTEVVEFVMLCGAGGIAIGIVSTGPASARLSLQSDSLRGGIACDERLQERFERVVTGLSRQLRSAIERDTETGRYALDVAIASRGE